MSKIYKQIVQSATEPDINCIWFHDGKLYYFDGGWKSIEDRVAPYVDLQIGNSDEVKQYNMERLQIGPFFTNIDYGFGVGTWNPTSGGTAHIVTAYGNTVYYNISEDGIVTKEFEAPDLYYEYTM
jgi:hypothetical protein